MSASLASHSPAVQRTVIEVCAIAQSHLRESSFSPGCAPYEDMASIVEKNTGSDELLGALSGLLALVTEENLVPLSSNIVTAAVAAVARAQWRTDDAHLSFLAVKHTEKCGIVVNEERQNVMRKWKGVV